MRLPVADSKTVRRRIAEILRERKKAFALVLALQLTAALLSVVTPMLIGRAIDGVSRGVEANYVRNIVAVFAGAVIVRIFVGYAGEYRASCLSERILTGLRNRVTWAVTHMPLGTVETAGTGDLLGRTTHDVERVQGLLQQGLNRVVVLVLTIVVTAGAAIALDPKLGIPVVLPIIPLSYAIRWYIRRAIPAYLAVSALRAQMSGFVSETIEQNATADALRLGPARVSRMEAFVREVWRNERYTAWVRGLFVMLAELLVSLPVLIAVLLGAHYLTNGHTTIGTVTAIALYALQLRHPLWVISWWIDEIQFASASFARIFGVDEALDRGPSRPPQTPEGRGLDIADAHFSYRDGEEVLHGVSLNVRPGEKLAIVGPSGAGKSTLGRLVAGINPPDRGSVAIGGAEVSAIPEKRLHSTVAMVTQEHHVFVGTIAENLRLAKAGASEGEMLAALATVDAGWVSELEDGLDTEVGSGKLVLDPARAQQIALARIVLLDPAVVVLDEATSLMDPGAARSLERSLARVLEGRTVVSIAHRLYTAHDADRVAVMIDGRLAELGSHDELVAREGVYAELWHAWQRD